MNSTLLSTIARFPGRRILLVGDFMLDRYVLGDADRISPEAPVPVLRVVERQDRVGGAGSVALNVAALGAQVQCFGLLGDDAFGKRVMQLLADAGADVSGLRVARDRPTITKTRLVGLAEHRHRQQILRVDEEIVRPPAQDDCAGLTQAIVTAVPQADVVCLEDYAKGVLCPELCGRVIAAARAAGRSVYVDPARKPEWDKYRGTTLITPNWNELEIAAGRRLGRDELAPAARDLIARHELTAIVVTLGRDGALLVTSDGQEHFPTVPRAVYDNTGAGDAVLAMLAVAGAAGATLGDAIALANIAGGLEVSKFGAVPITTEEVERELRDGARRGRGKLRDVSELCEELTARRQRGETIVFTNGCFDILHPGHLELLEKAKALGSVLLVGVNSDASVRSLGKGDDRPIRREADRARLLAALECVDYVVLFGESDPQRLIERVCPDVLVKGSDWAGRGVVGQAFVEARGGRVVLVDLVEGYSTTDELRRIRAATAPEPVQPRRGR